jgi:hypothetical protein
VPDIPVQRRRDKQAAKPFFRDPLKGLPYGQRMIITDQLKRHGVALRKLLPDPEHRQHRRKTPTNQHTSGNDGCSGSSRPGAPGASSGAPSKMLALDHADHAREVTGLRTTATNFALWVIGDGMAWG